MMYWYGFGWPWAVGMWGGMVLFWGLIALGIYAVVRVTTRPAGSRGGDARRVLDERLARGEIDAEEYRRLRDLIGSGGAGRPTEGAGMKPGYQKDKAALQARLGRIEGQVRGVSRMVAADEYCIDVLTQINAIKRAIDQVGLLLLEDHVKTCVVDRRSETRRTSSTSWSRRWSALPKRETAKARSTSPACDLEDGLPACDTRPT